jgi:hypothetical protein
LNRTARKQVNELVGYSPKVEFPKNRKQTFRVKQARSSLSYTARLARHSEEVANGIRVVNISNASLR